jgi:hypothetical protein
MFAVIGAILTIYGIVSDKAIYARSLDININLWWGLSLLAFGIVMFLLGRRGTSAVRPASESVEGQKIEQLEHGRGLEHDNMRRGH